MTTYYYFMENKILRIAVKENEQKPTKILQEQTTKMFVIERQIFVSTTKNNDEKTTNFYVIKDKEILKKISLPLTNENIEKLERVLDSIHTKEEIVKVIIKPIDIRR